MNRQVVHGRFFFDDVLQACALMGVSKNSGTPKSSILIGFSIIFTIHFGVAHPDFWKHPDGPVKHWNHNQLQPASASPPRVIRAYLPPRCSRPEQQGYVFLGLKGVTLVLKTPRNS